MPTKDDQRIRSALAAVKDIRDRYTNPHRLKADLDVLSLALRRLPTSLTGLRYTSRAWDLSDLLQVFAKAELLSNDAVMQSRLLDEIAEVADYDVADEEELASASEEAIPFLKKSIKEFLQKLEQSQQAGAVDSSAR